MRSLAGDEIGRCQIGGAEADALEVALEKIGRIEAGPAEVATLEVELVEDHETLAPATAAADPLEDPPQTRFLAFTLIGVPK